VVVQGSVLVTAAPLEDFVMDLSTELLGVGPDDLAGSIRDALEQLCGVLEVDRGYIYKTDSQRPEIQVFEEWWSPGIEQRNTPIAELPLEAQRFWVRSMRTGEVVHADDLEQLEELCPEAAEALRGDGVLSILFVPLLAKAASVGFIGFEGRRRNIEWPPLTISRMRTVGELLVSAVDRCQADADRARAAKDLAARNAELERSNRELQQFASIVSHDLKAPLVVAQGFLEVLSTIAQEHPTRAGEAVSYTDAARRSMTRMRTLIDDVLAFARTGAGLVEPVPVDLAVVAADVLADLAADIESAGATVIVEDLPTIEGSPTQLHQLVQNLVANALKFRQPDRATTISISSAVEGRRCVLAVADNGVGIAPERRSSVFEMFARGTDDATPGLGIGLAVCARVVANHHGKIWIDGNDSGGATLRISLPLRQAAPAPQA
jgi:signal transduction histidine kinase